MKDNVCNLNTNKCEPKSDNVYSFNYKDQNIILSTSEKSKELEIKLKNNNTLSQRFVSLETPDNKVIYDETEEKLLHYKTALGFQKLFPRGFATDA